MKTFPTAWSRVPATVETPVGTACLACSVPIQDGDVGLVMPYVDGETVTDRPWHRTCFLAALGIKVERA